MTGVAIAVASDGTEAGSEPLRRPPLAASAVAALAVGKVAFHLATAGVWGFHRDEFYYLAGGRHLDWGYVDHPPFTPLLYRVGDLLFGDSQLGLRVVPALLAGALVVVAALLAREVGGGRRAQLLTATVACLGPLYLTTAHFLGTVTVDLLAWSVATLLVIRIVRGASPRWWLAVGLAVGAGLLNKHSMLFWVGGVGVGLLATPQRRILRSPWAVAGGALALGLFAPNLVWQARHHWPTIEFARHLRERTGRENLLEFVPLQLGIVTPAALVLWGAALRRLGRARGSWSDLRWLAVAYVVLFVALFASQGKAYYLGSIYLPLVAIGAVLVEREWSDRARRRLTVAVIATGVVVAPIFTPLLPANVLQTVPLHEVNSDAGAMLGWHEAAQEVAAVFQALPAGEQPTAKILGATYSMAGAVDHWRQELHLPAAISGHNSYWSWGYGDPSEGTVVVIGFDRTFLAGLFTSCDDAAVLHDRRGLMDAEAADHHVWVCRGLRRPWAQLWPELRMYG